MTRSRNWLRPPSVSARCVRLGAATAFLCAVCLAAATSPARAGINVWTSHGPEGGYISALVVYPTREATIYAGTAGGVFAIELVNACPGDCAVDGGVSVDEILTLVNIALDNMSIVECGSGDADGDNQITVDEILTAVNRALNGCS